MFPKNIIRFWFSIKCKCLTKIIKIRFERIIFCIKCLIKHVFKFSSIKETLACFWGKKFNNVIIYFNAFFGINNKTATSFMIF